ncbi:hypothetical protein SARC_05828 [Sphaeroforma arctica JP610]|uniref:NWD2 C-terminal beta-propeller domain-containing protein n=1 Tax=Sphaeroforma arctica JP610 TaxID=667725 RepID=A0A0L0G0Y6_9EUKA|nr:hypothetical protein SARC_05828 [Sphaeroforma arctica JP610]KNC81868.1 hypothetical protein SARC_05828 [Sphaeroforma arctica JP610]|eukprot:XP_014155770.1 hypothetical protein SARC_05828 [Sphaeroforma arctica JP610]
MYTAGDAVEKAHDDGIWSVSWSGGRANRIVTGGIDQFVRVWNGDTLERVLEIEGHELGINCVSVNEDATVAVSTSLDSTVNVWNLESGVLLRSIKCGPEHRAWSAAICPKPTDGINTVAVSTHSGAVLFYNIDTGERVSELTTRGKFNQSIAFSPNAKYFAAGAIDGTLHIFSLGEDKKTYSILHKIEAHAMPVRGLEFSPDSELILTGSDDSIMNMYDVAQGNMIQSFSGHLSWVTSLAFNPKNSQFASGVIEQWESTFAFSCGIFYVQTCYFGNGGIRDRHTHTHTHLHGCTNILQWLLSVF